MTLYLSNWGNFKIRLWNDIFLWLNRRLNHLLTAHACLYLAFCGINYLKSNSAIMHIMVLPSVPWVKASKCGWKWRATNDWLALTQDSCGFQSPYVSKLTSSDAHIEGSIISGKVRQKLQQIEVIILWPVNSQWWWGCAMESNKM